MWYNDTRNENELDFTEIIMRIKKLAVALAAIVCAIPLASCTSPSKKVAFGEYWRTDVNSPQTIDETLTYSVAFEENKSISPDGYKFSYSEGSYITRLTTKAEDNEYVYATELSISVTYTYGDEEPVTFNDRVSTEVRFTGAGLTPVSSKKSVVSHSPINGTPSSLKGCYSAYDFEINTTYTENGEAKSVVTGFIDKGEKSERKLDKTSEFDYSRKDYSYLDNEQLPLALRAFPDSSTSETVETYNPFLEQIQKVKVTLDQKTSQDFPHVKRNGQPLADSNLSFRTVTMVLSEKNPGTTQTMKIATVTSPTNNVNRNVILSMTTPLSYGFGSLVYSLTNIQID